VEAVKLTRGSLLEKEELVGYYEDGAYLWELMKLFADKPKVHTYIIFEIMK
jgi:hypothetical protein